MAPAESVLNVRRNASGKMVSVIVRGVPYNDGYAATVAAASAETGPQVLLNHQKKIMLINK